MQNKTEQKCECGTSKASILHVPGGVTNPSSTSLVPAELFSAALYIPAVAEVAVMVRVKLKDVVPAGEVEQGLSMVYTPLRLMALPFTLHCMVEHGSAVTTANSLTSPPTLCATKSDFPMILSIVR